MNGEVPSHPELLDWLAVEFRESGWDVKRFFRLLVTSAAYRQAAIVTPEKLAGDPQNRLLSAGRGFAWTPRWFATMPVRQRTVGAEDRRPERQAVSAGRRVGSGGHDRQQHARLRTGPGREPVPPQPVHVLETGGAAGVDGNLQRAEPRNLHGPPRADQYAAAGSGDAERSAVRRSGPPLGADRRLSTDGSADNRLQWIAERLLSRPLRAEELALVKSSLIDSLTYYAAARRRRQKLIAVGESKADPQASPAVLAAWTMLANELMNLDEVLNK